MKDISIVINFDMPNSIEDYVHRIGRTGRAGAKGVSYSFISASESSLANDLCKVLLSSNQEIPQRLHEIKRSSGGRGGQHHRMKFRRPGGSFPSSNGYNNGAGSKYTKFGDNDGQQS